MFGYIVVNKGDMKFKEFDVYQSYYCGLCRALKEKHGAAGQLSLTYDMTFLVMLLTSLYEPETREDKARCMVHPLSGHLARVNEFSRYGADMNVLFTYYKCRDDWEDERKAGKLAYGRALKKSYRKVRAAYPEKTRKIDSLMRELARQEKRSNHDIDAMSGLFGEIMAQVMTPKADEWQELLHTVGCYLGKFIYLLDAYEDILEDQKKGRYNPLAERFKAQDFDEEVGTILTMIMAECCRAFEKLPVIEHVEILRNILYSGVWSKYEAVKQSRRKAQIEKGNLQEIKSREQA